MFRQLTKELREADRLDETAFLILLSVFCFCASIFRRIYVGSWGLFFLNWNLFLAFVPWALTSISFIKPKIRQSAFSVALLLIFWLLFFPNAPYIITDLFHLRVIRTMPIWYDTLLILSYAWTGLICGFISLKQLCY